MKNYSSNTEDTFITFHTGRGGRYNNASHTVYVDQDKNINTYTNDLFIAFENFDLVFDRIKENSILSRHESRILDLITDAEGQDSAAIENLAEFGITLEELGTLIYITGGGRSPVGLEVENDGTGSIDVDGEYDTTTVCLLKDVNENEAHLILKSNNWASEHVKAFLIEKFQLEEYQEN